MYCKRCKRKIKLTEKYCPYCGLKQPRWNGGINWNFLGILALTVICIVLMGISFGKKSSKPYIGTEKGTCRTEEEAEQILLADISDEDWEIFEKSNAEIHQDAEKYSGSDGYVKEKDTVKAIKAVTDCVEKLYKKGIVTYYSSSEDGVSYEFASGIRAVYSPSIAEMAAGAGTQGVNILALDPFAFEKNRDNTAYITGTLIKNSLTNQIMDFYENDEVTLNLLKSIPKSDFLLWAGHGSTGTFGKTTYPLLVTGQIADRELIKQTYDTALDVAFTDDGYCEITPHFVEKYMSLENSLVYLGPCYSGNNDTLADAFQEIGAEVVFVSVKDRILSDYSSYMMQTIMSYLAGRKDGIFHTAGEALSMTKEEVEKSIVEENCWYLNGDVVTLPEDKHYSSLQDFVDRQQYGTQVETRGNDNYTLCSCIRGTIDFEDSVTESEKAEILKTLDVQLDSIDGEFIQSTTVNEPEFYFNQLEPGIYYVSLYKNGKQITPKDKVEVKSHRYSKVALPYGELVPLEGYVYDMETGEPMSDVTISASGTSFEYSAETKSDSDGYYCVEVFGDNPYTLTYSLNGYQSVSNGFTVTTEMDEKAQDGIATSLEDVALSEVKIGDTVLFGAFEQDGNLKNGSEPIEWIVLDIQDGAALLVSSVILEEAPYADGWEFTWENCSLREWLNGEFQDSAFSDEEKKQICTTRVCTMREEKWDSITGNDVQDQVFILSATEFDRYLPDYRDRQCSFTTYSIRNAESSRSRPWGVWLRCNSDNSYARYMKNGDFFYEGEAMKEFADTEEVGVRPAIWVNLSGEIPQEMVMGEDIQSRQTQTGDVIEFGELDWRVLAIEDDRLLLITERCLSEKMVFDSAAGSSAWSESSIRSWLNDEFLDTYLGAEAEKQILTTTVVTEGCENTEDQVFLLSADEVSRYFYTYEERKTCCGVPGGRTAEWYLRSADDILVQTVATSGLISRESPGRSACGIRPAVWAAAEDFLQYRPETTSSSEESEQAETDQTKNPYVTAKSTEAVNYLMDDCVLKEDERLSGTVFGSKYHRDSIESITFTDNFEKMPSDAWDVSRNGDKSIMAWVTYDESNEWAEYDLTIASEKPVVAENCRDLFAGYHYMTSISFNNLFQTTGTDNLYRMFYGDKMLEKLDVSFFDTSQVGNMYGVFARCIKLKELDVSKWDTSKTVDFSSAFKFCVSLQELDLSSWDMSSAGDASQMFYACSSLASLGSESLLLPEDADTTDMYVRTQWE